MKKTLVFQNLKIVRTILICSFFFFRLFLKNDTSLISLIERSISFVHRSFFSNIYFLEVAEIMVYQHLRDIYNECYTPR